MSSENMKLAKVQKSCRIAKRVSTIFAALSIVATITCLIVAASCTFLGDTINEAIADGEGYFSTTTLATNGVLKFSVNLDSMIAAGNYAGAIVATTIFATVVCLFTAVIFMQIRKVFVKIEKSETPFSTEILASMKRIFIVLTITCGLFVGIGPCIMIGCILWSLYCIMDYGTVLQNEVDDTI